MTFDVNADAIEGIELPIKNRDGASLYCYVVTAPKLVPTGYYQAALNVIRQLSDALAVAASMPDGPTPPGAMMNAREAARHALASVRVGEAK